jgi:cytochrome c oxidase subunit 4
MSDGHENTHHIIPVKVYLGIYGLLMLLTATTVAVAYKDLDLGAVPLNLAIALTIAMVKTLLVVLYFMHVRYSHHLVKIFVAAGFLWLIIMVGVTLSDYLTRSWISIPRGWQ